MHPLRAYIHRFVALTDAEWAPLSAGLQVRHLARRELFVTQGQPSSTIALLVAGACRLFYTRPDGEEKTTYFFFENHLMASYQSCLTGQPSAFGIEALAPTEVLVFPYALLAALYDEWPVYERFGRLLAEYHLLGTDARLAELLLLSPEQRYRALLSSHKTKILERVPQHYIASYLGVTPVSLSRIRARLLEDDGRIS
ncbi:Crp/Fnr family transcriptional regulator [Hymenobacter sp. BT186]|uniref:Crp/Fnr family transcriptional regulator n=1 Tax=Hymenobacter telluris TaxID=2816474 RepID=A0A939EVK5_9BACT|nr:Crp/Fnr family transcriptional regulator [Hymenobacter telluris]MBO0358021.1 Crp/Fnr family transcriptional regulator [Hymenobacter telluris]MBW3374048.1 Crp/Fnr family transcriptional regulator [Hymenobacter norwichensis]